jgi:hypothetical protein
MLSPQAHKRRDPQRCYQQLRASHDRYLAPEVGRFVTPEIANASPISHQ